MTEKLMIVCNGDESKNIVPTLIFAASGLSLDQEVYIFLTPAGSKWALKGEIEKLGQPKGLPDPLNLFNDVLDLGGHIVLCVLALENKGIDPKDVRDPRITIGEAPPFLMAAEGAGLTFTF
jgi:predicted peroxiredoxin